jgi:isoleucyl-tRNA synthetase
LTTEVIWRGLEGGRSVHLTNWPTADELTEDAELVAAMDEIREIASVSLSVRKAAKLRVRQPLAALTVATRNAERLRPFVSLLADEVNVRQVELTELADGDDRVSRQLSVNARAAGPRLGRDVQKVIKASKAGDWTVGDDGAVVCGGFALVEGEYTLELVATGSSSDAVGLLRSGGFVSLDTVLDDDLLADGAVSDLLRLVQQARKDAGLEVSDRIHLTLDVPDELWTAVLARIDTVKAETLALEVQQGSIAGDSSVQVARAVGATVS